MYNIYGQNKMSKDLEHKDPIEAPNSVESQPSSSGEDISPLEKTESAAAGSPSVAVSEELMAKIVNLCEKNSEAAINLNKRLNDLSEKLGIIKEDVDKNKPLHVQAKVTGVYNYEKRQKEIVDEYQLADRSRAKNLFNFVKNKYPNG